MQNQRKRPINLIHHLFCLGILSGQLVAAPKSTPAKPNALPTPAFKYQPQNIDAWYVVPVSGFNYAYYHDKFQVEANKPVQYQSNQYVNLRSTIAEENLTSQSLNNPSLTPQWFSLRRQEGPLKEEIDGTITNNKLVVTKRSTRSDAKAVPPPQRFEHSVPSPTIFTGKLPLFLARHAEQIPEGATIDFFVINENDNEKQFKPDPAKATRKGWGAPPASANSKEQCLTFELQLLGQASTACIFTSGQLASFSSPDVGMSIIPTDQRTAKQFFVLPLNSKGP